MYREKIDAYIESKKEEMIQDMMDLCQIDSQKTAAKEGMPYGEGPAKALAAASALMEKYGFAVKNYDNRVVTGDFSSAEKKLDILAHLDVVPVTEDWTMTQPFEPKVIGDRVYGRGTADDKGPAIAALYALRAIKDLGLPMEKSVRLILGSDEECGSSDLAYYYSVEEEAPYSFTPDADFPLINMEKGRLAPKFSADFMSGLVLPGVISFDAGSKVNVVPQRAEFVTAGLEADVVRKCADEVTAATGVEFVIDQDEKGNLVVKARGMAAHASTPQEGKNALTASLKLIAGLPLADSEGHRALKALNELLPYEDVNGVKLGIYREEAVSGKVTVAFSILHYTPVSVTGEFDCRLANGCNEENTCEPLKVLFAEKNMKLEGEFVEPHYVPGDSWFVRTLLDSYTRYTGKTGEPMSTGGGTYVHELKRGVAFGCMLEGVDNHMHGDDEFMEISTLVMSAKIFADAVIKICNSNE